MSLTVDFESSRSLTNLLLSPNKASCFKNLSCEGIKALILFPSKRRSFFFKKKSSEFQNLSLDNTKALPTKTIPYFALVNATFYLRSSLKNPIPRFSLDLTIEINMISFSRPWNESIEAISISLYTLGFRAPVRNKN